MTYAIETHALRRAFGDVTAVDGLNLAVPEGSVFGFLGPNGAGKTTTIRMLLGLIAPDAGEIHLNGENLRRARAMALSGVGAIVESPALYPNLTGREIMVMAARLSRRPIKEALELLERLQLTAAMNRRVSDYSLGMRQRLALARAMLGEPRLLILDEPTNGLDPAGIADMRDLIKALPSTLGATVFLSSHLLSEIEQTATHCALINKGRLLFQDRLERFAETLSPTLVIETDQPERLVNHFNAQNIQVDRIGSQVRAQLALDDSARAQLIARLVRDGFAISGVWVERPTLEDFFLQQTRQTDAESEPVS